MKICWDTLEKLRYDKEKMSFYNKFGNKVFYIKSCIECEEPFLGNNIKCLFCDHACYSKSQYKKDCVSKTHKGKKISDEQKYKLSIAFSGENNHRYGKKRSKITREKISRSKKGKFLGDKNHNWKGGIKNPLYNTHASKINWCDEVRRNPYNTDYLQVRCTYCGKWFTPTTISIQNRYKAINEFHYENRFYCSQSCKKLCPIYRKKKYSDEELDKNNLSREVQPELRQLVFERDNYKCIKCKKEGYLQCHHIEGILWNPIESADVDNCITLCKKCHKEAHKIEGCSYYDMRCS